MGFIVAVPISTPEDELVVPGSALKDEVELPLSAMFGLGAGGCHVGTPIGEQERYWFAKRLFAQPERRPKWRTAG
ncbi:hypothetical protein J3459_015772 [Metarhizium acridum]|uniref:uncharacterized protein n=1 Tax=Metarhizium acridum TaxID=92637 RepID=UPI001C6C82EE|nr:hypothetical protein J3458_015330 [Metarhizium acridum]KAG8413129.1 hypothetical protein J3459_015772 [Metarhizium acridum]